MNLYDIMKRRRSVRYFKHEKIPEQILNELLDVANNAPSGGNIQPISIIVVETKESREELAKIVGYQPWVKNAPISMLFCIDYYRVKRWAAQSNTTFQGERLLSFFLIAYADIMCAAQNVVVLAESYGLGSVFVGSILQSIDKARDFFSIPKYVVPVMILSLGYPEYIPSYMPKLERNITIHKEKYHILSDDEIKKAYEQKYGDFDVDAETYLEKAYIEVVEADKQQDESWVEWAKDRMKKLDIQNHAQFLFNLRYPTQKMAKWNKKQMQLFKNAGFDFL